MPPIVKAEVRSVVVLAREGYVCAVENVSAREESGVAWMSALHHRGRVCRGVGGCDVCVSAAPRLQHWATPPCAPDGVDPGPCGYLFFWWDCGSYVAEGYPGVTFGGLRLELVSCGGGRRCG